MDAAWDNVAFPGGYPTPAHNVGAFSEYIATAYLNTVLFGATFPAISGVVLALGATGGNVPTTPFSWRNGLSVFPFYEVSTAILGYSRPAMSWSVDSSSGQAKYINTNAISIGFYDPTRSHVMDLESLALFDGSGQLLMHFTPGGSSNSVGMFGHYDPASAWTTQMAAGDLIVYTDNDSLTSALLAGTTLTPHVVTHMGLLTHSGGLVEFSVPGYSRRALTMSSVYFSGLPYASDVLTEFSWTTGATWPDLWALGLFAGATGGSPVWTIPQYAPGLPAGSLIHHAPNAVQVSY